MYFSEGAAYYFYGAAEACHCNVKVAISILSYANPNHISEDISYSVPIFHSAAFKKITRKLMRPRSHD